MFSLGLTALSFEADPGSSRVRSLKRLRGLTSTTLLSVIAALLVIVPARPAGALIGNVIPANEFEEPTDTFTTANALIAFATVDPLGGRICVVPASTENPGDGSLSCDGAEPWASPNFVSGIGTQIVPIKGPFLKVGQWKLLGDSSRDARDALSITFTVSPCVDCDTTIADEILARWKAAAGVSEEAMGNVCKAATLYGRAGTVKAAGTNIRKAREIAPERAFVAQVVLAGALTFAVFPTFSPQEFMARGMEMIADLSCAVTQMYTDIVADPPDPNFLEIAVPRPYTTPVSGDPLIDALSGDFSDVAANGEAMLTSFERYLGAIEAGNVEASGMQAQAMADFGETITVAMRETADHLRAFGDEADADPEENDPVVTQAELNEAVAVYERVRRDGFTTDELQQLRDAGLTQEEIDIVRAAFDLDISQAPVDRSFNDIVQEAANDLDAAADEFIEVSLAAGSVAATIAASTGSNQPPNAQADDLITTQDTPSQVNVLANDSDPEADGLTVTGFTQGTHGTVDCTNNGLCTYTPETGFTGSDGFTYTVSDGKGGSAEGAVTVTVRAPDPSNNPPVAQDDSLTTVANAPGQVNVLVNDSDPDADGLSVTGFSQGSAGAVSCELLGQCTYTPNTDFTGADSFTYTVSDGNGGTAVGTVSVTVQQAEPGNNPPVAQDDSLTTHANKEAAVFVLQNDSDPDFDSVQVTAATDPMHGTVDCPAHGFCNYTPDTDYVGPDGFDYRISDGRGGSDTASVSIVVDPNQPPVAVDDVLTTRQDASTPRTVFVLQNDSDGNFDQLVIQDNTDPAHGTATCSSFACDYVPDPGYQGPDSFDYTLSDTFGGTDVGTVQVTVEPNHVPVAVDDSAETTRGFAVSLAVLSNDSDQDQDPLSVVDNTQPANGTVTCQPIGFCDYSPAEGYEGPDSFEYTVSDGTDTAVARVNIEVRPPCHPAECISNDTILLAVNPEGHLNVPDARGSSAGPGAAGLTFLPTGNEATAPGCLCEGWGAADAASAVTGFANVAVDGVQNLSVERFDATAATAVSVVTIGESMRVSHDYHPSPNTSNLYEVTVTIENISNQALGDVRYRRVMDWDVEPTAFSEFVTIDAGNASELLFSSNNGFASANPLSGPSDLGNVGSFTDAGPSDHGALFDFGFGALAPGGFTTFKIFYGAAANETEAEVAVNAAGAEVFSFGQPNTADGPTMGTPNTFIFAFGEVGGEPIFSPDAVDDELTTQKDTPGTINVLTNDSDPNDDPLAVTTAVPDAANGSVECTEDGICTYTPDSGFVGTDSFLYSITDGKGGTDTASVRVTVVDIVDTRRPSCTVIGRSPTELTIQFRDTGSGLREIVVTNMQNVTVDVPLFQQATTDPVVVTGTKVDPAQPSRFRLTAMDMANNVARCTSVGSFLLP